jgi:coenzyme F420-dependent glucose-6-phosphate dehydrogenase
MPPKIAFAASHEQFPPSDLLRRAVEAERAGFHAVGCSDHFQPWWPDGESGQAWVWLGAAAHATERVPVGTGVTPPGARYHPALIAQAFMTLEEMFPGRTFLGIGSGEALNEVPLGGEWPSPAGQIAAMDEALEIITRLWEGETLTYDGAHFSTTAARLYTRAEGRPKLYVSAFGPQAAEVAGRWGDGVWTLGDPDSVPPILESYRASADAAGREPGEVILQAGFSWAADDDAALEGARVWKSTQMLEYFADDWHDPRAMYENAEAKVTDDDFKQSFIIASDPGHHVERIREVEKLGATIVCIQNGSGSAPERALEVYGESVLPALRG